MKKVFKLGEFFSGPGGLGLGAKLANNKFKNKDISLEHSWASDYDQDSCDTYSYNISDKNIYCTPVEKFFSLIDNKKIKLPKFNAFAYGFPCNDFSNVGEHKGFKGKFGPLYSYGVELMNRYNPDWFLAENVSGMSSANEGEAFKKILNELGNSGEGYNLTVHKYKFEEYGIPQARHRIIIVGFNKKFGNDFYFKVPKPSEKTVTVREVLTKPFKANDPNHIFTKNSKQVIERLKYIKPGQSAFTAKLPKSLTLNVKGAKISQIYKRLHPDKPAYTVTGSGGGGTHMYHWSEHRALTNRERARLQTFPDSFIFKGSKESQRKQIGMAVPVDGARIIFEAILNCFEKNNYQYVEPNIKI
ncbi:DNA cytosine methyltransferase [Candidatus Pelagibacter communis]|uniref:DNA cytosine methyltransferase n=1 Tax=Pelagibacter ubique TaxID=198252 RepID=UPI00065B4284|nr:DNA cytosine methyltransferase [Candidatus Pelagibacter ubique]